MLLSLHIENYALIRSLDILFDQGFTVITGETGAGKSILLGALSLVTGQRADSSQLHDKTLKCFVEAEFDIQRLHLHPFFEEHNLDYANHTILRREINNLGKSRAFINDTPVTLPQLKELSDQLIDIHSQHQHLLIHDALFRLQIVDNYANNQTLLEKYQHIHRQHETVVKELHSLKKIQQEMEERRSYLSFLSKELESTGLQTNEDKELEEKIAVMSNAETIKSTLYAANQHLSDQEVNAISLLKEVKRDCEQLSSYSTAITELTKRLENILIESQDISYSLSKIENQIEVDPEQLAFLQQRLDTLYTLLRKHHVNDVNELIDKHRDIDEQLLSIDNNSEQIEKLDTQRVELNAKLQEKANQLTENRLAAIPGLQQEILSKLQALGMKDSHFHIDIENRLQHNETGNDKVSFFFSANKGIPEEEISKIASGGELSRIMLAIKSVITESSLLPTVVFDEIDTGISGDVAGKVAKMMKDLSSNHQLVSITHLPQIAAKATLHYHVYKEVINDKTYTNIRKLTTEERIEELAKMMSNETVTAAARNTAKMLMGI
ncbi:MAG: DNA repair protein RecN [Bacteroidales bacterium]|jgi:DNA repair protein RecN (Recombination protein N)|nr:DNA repair protein RecN [Bacteroidales bacterium]